MNDPLVASLVTFGAFLVGFLIGLTFREAVVLARSGHTFPMPLRSLPPLRIRTVLLSLVLASLLVNALLGFLLILARAATEGEAAKREEAAERDRTILRCLVVYNTRLGNALEQRDDRAENSTDAAVQLWNSLRLTLSGNNQGETRADLLAAIDVYLATLAGTQQTRDANPYPPPDLCLRRVR